jgi:hypothetical protein
VSAAAWGSFVFFGDAEGLLVAWDTTSGRAVPVDTGAGKVHRMHAGPPRCGGSDALNPAAAAAAGSAIARLAVLFASGIFAVYEVDPGGTLRGTTVSPGAARDRVGRVTDVGFLRMPEPIGGSSIVVFLPFPPPGLCIRT